MRLTNYRALTMLMKTGMPGPEGSVSKLTWSESNQRLTKLALEILGPDAQLSNGDGHGYCCARRRVEKLQLLHADLLGVQSPLAGGYRDCCPQ